MALLKDAEDSLIVAKMAEYEGYYRPQKVKQVEDGMMNTCRCDPLLRVPNTATDQSETLLKYTVPFKVNQTSRPGDIKEGVPKELGPEDPLLTDGSLETQEVLDCIKEPRCWMTNGEKWMQVVSPSTSKRQDIAKLLVEFNKRIWSSDSRPRGVCRKRFALFCQLFDELTRQVTVTRAERGLFLVRIRFELMHTIRTYHHMWRDTMEYFDPIIEKSVEILEKLKVEIADLEKTKEEIQREIDEVRWKTHLLEQDRAYERKSLLDWFKCKIHEEIITMQQLKTLLSVSSPKDFDSSRISAISGEDSKMAQREMPSKSEEYELIAPLELSDILKDLITERKTAEGRMETKKLLEHEITWVKGEISKNKGFVSDLLRLREPLNFHDWLDTWLEGKEHPGLASTSFTGPHTDFAHKMERDSRPSFAKGLTAKYDAFVNKSLEKWLKDEGVVKCCCSAGEGIHDQCTKIDFELVKFHAMVEYLKMYDDSPHLKFDQFFKQYKKETKVKNIPILLNHIRSQFGPSTLGSSNLASFFQDPDSEEEIQEIEEETVSVTKEPFKILFSSIRDALTRKPVKANKK